MLTRIIIIGAGVSGLAAASKLLELGFHNIKILEARDRVGGRINTIIDDGGIIELGAQWIHGEDNNVLFQIASELDAIKLPNIPTEFVNVFSFLNSGSMVEKDLHDCAKDLFHLIENSIQEESKRVEGKSLWNFYKEKFEDFILNHPHLENHQSIMNSFLVWYDKYESSISGSNNTSEISMKRFPEYLECPGNPLVNWKRGYETIIQYFNNLLNEDMILLNKEVLKIYWNDPSLEGVKIECTDGKSFMSDVVICSIPLGCLKQNSSGLFIPNLPSKTKLAIENLGYGVVDKIFLHFDTNWWPDNINGFHLLWESEIGLESEIMKDNYWAKDIFGFYTVPSHPQVLCGWIQGQGAQQMEIVDDKTILEVCFELLIMFVGKTYTVSRPSHVTKSHWGTDPYSRGSYTFLSLESEITGISPNDLATPLEDYMGQPKVVFAGEATHPRYFSTVHGAIETGFRAATFIEDNFA